MQQYVTYILFSAKYNKIYIGYTSDLISRFKSHNQLATKGFTKKFRPWLVIHVEFFNSKFSSMEREKQLKSSRGRNFIHNSILPYFKNS